MNDEITSLSYNLESGNPELVVNREPLINNAAGLSRWIMETEERLVIDTLLVNGGIDSIKRLHGVLGKALEEHKIAEDAGIITVAIDKANDIDSRHETILGRL